MLHSITLKFTASNQVTIPAQGVTIFVGANNSGKSLVLREIETDFSNHQTIESKIVESVDFVWPSEAELVSDFDILSQKAPVGISPDDVYIGKFRPDGNLEAASANRKALIEFVRTKNNKRWMSSQFLKYFLIRLDGRTRFELTNDQSRGDLLAQAQNTLTHLFKDEEIRKQIKELVFDAFGVYFTIDALSQNSLRIRLSRTPPTDDEQNLNQAARDFHGKALYIKEASDGVQAYIGILCAVLSGDYRAILIDEPEAFLHPPLARKLGHQLTSKLKTNGSLVAATHSPDFLIGCLQASPNVRVVRLEYVDGQSRGKIVDSTVLTRFFKTPLLRSANVISALFHDGVVVTESDNDRAFYSEIYYRLAEREKGYPSLLFVNAQNKQTIRDIIGPLRDFGIPSAAIVDIDILKDGGRDWTSWLSSAQLPPALHGSFGQLRGDLKKKYSDLGIDMKADGGVDALPPPDQNAINELFDTLDKYGIFVVRRGEMETWLKHLGVPGKKTDWTIAMLEKLGEDPNNSSYVQPANGDVWDFVRKIISWMKDPARKGTS